MLAFNAQEFSTETIQPTGREHVYLANTIDEAVQHCLYTCRLANAAAKVGQTGRVVYTGNGTAWSVIQPRS